MEPAIGYGLLSVGGVLLLVLVLRLVRPGGDRKRVKARDVSGIVVIGDVHGDVRQLAGRAQPLRGHDPLAWLHWKSRLAPTLVGREREMASLRRWATEGRGVRARVLSGEGGTGKTRLAAELAQDLRDQGWQAGFAALRRSGDGAAIFSTGARGTLILLDYPEKHREATRAYRAVRAAVSGGLVWKMGQNHPEEARANGGEGVQGPGGRLNHLLRR